MTVSLQLANMWFIVSFSLLTLLEGTLLFLCCKVLPGYLSILLSWHHAHCPVAMAFMIAVLVDRTLSILGRVCRLVMFAKGLVTYV
jgi:hypothetical protein